MGAERERGDGDVSPVVEVRGEDLRARRAELLEHLGMTLSELESKATAYALTTEQREAWEELGNISFLLGEQ